MKSRRNAPRLLLWLPALLVPLLMAATPAEQLSEATRLFEQGDYQKAQQVLLDVDRDKLDDTQKTGRDKLIEELKSAIPQSNRARQQLEDGRKAYESKNTAKARELYQAVLDNKYAGQAQQRQARDGLSLIQRQESLDQQVKTEVARPRVEPGDQVTVIGSTAVGGGQMSPVAARQTPPRPIPAAPAAAVSVSASGEAGGLIQAGDAAAARGQFDLAEQKYQQVLKIDPNNPAAIAGLEDIRQQRAAEGQPGLLEESTARRKMNWERAVLQFQTNEAEIRRLAEVEHSFEQARDLLAQTTSQLDAVRLYAEPPEAYERLAGSLAALGRHIDREQEYYAEEQAQLQRSEAIERERERFTLDQKERDDAIAQLMSRVGQLRKEREYDKAVDVLNEVLVMDPNFERAKWMIDDLHSTSVLRKQVQNRREFLEDFQSAMEDVERTRTPVVIGDRDEPVKYPDPKRWQIISKRDPFGEGLTGETEADTSTRLKLQQTLPTVNFPPGTRFEDAIEFFRQQGDVSIDVNWRTLADFAIDQNTEVSGINLREVKLEAALDVVLSNVAGPEVEVGADLIEGILRISTREDLDRKTITRVYDVRDLLVKIQSFSAPSNNQGGGLGGFGGGGLGGGGLGGFGGGGLGGGGLGGFGGGGLGGGGFGGGGFGGGGGGFGGGGGGGFGGQGDDDDDDSSEEDREELITELEDMIKEQIAPGTWTSGDGAAAGEGIGSLNVWNDRMIVRHTAGVHEQLRDLLKQLRESKDIQVVVEARFITMTSNFLEEIGVDLDVVLNSGNAGYDNAVNPQGFPVRDPATGALLMQPRRATQLGFLPSPGGFGQPLVPGGPFGQPYQQVGYVPQGSAGNYWDRHTTPIPLVNNTSDLTAPRTTGVPGSLGGGVVDPAFQVFGSFLDNIQVDFMMRATQMDARKSSVDAPRLSAYNGRSAYIQVNTLVSYVASPGFTPVGGTGVGGEAALGAIPITSSLPRGRTLEVTPTVSADRKYVTLQVQPEVTDVQFNTIPVQQGAIATFFQTPEFSITEIKTAISVPDGGTALLGGLKLAGETEVEAGVPILSKIPVLKRAYTNRSRVKDEFVLLILLKPTIIIQEEQEELAYPDMFTTDTRMP